MCLLIQFEAILRQQLVGRAQPSNLLQFEANLKQFSRLQEELCNKSVQDSNPKVVPQTIFGFLIDIARQKIRYDKERKNR